MIPLVYSNFGREGSKMKGDKLAVMVVVAVKIEMVMVKGGGGGGE